MFTSTDELIQEYQSVAKSWRRIKFCIWHNDKTASNLLISIKMHVELCFIWHIYCICLSGVTFSEVLYISDYYISHSKITANAQCWCFFAEFDNDNLLQFKLPFVSCWIKANNKFAGDVIVNLGCAMSVPHCGSSVETLATKTSWQNDPCWFACAACPITYVFIVLFRCGRGQVTVRGTQWINCMLSVLCVPFSRRFRPVDCFDDILLQSPTDCV